MGPAHPFGVRDGSFGDSRAMASRPQRTRPVSRGQPAARRKLGERDGYGLVPTLSATEAVLTSLPRERDRRASLLPVIDAALRTLGPLLRRRMGRRLPDTPAIEIIIPALTATVNAHLIVSESLPELDPDRYPARLRLPTRATSLWRRSGQLSNPAGHCPRSCTTRWRSSRPCQRARVRGTGSLWSRRAEGRTHHRRLARRDRGMDRATPALEPRSRGRGLSRRGCRPIRRTSAERCASHSVRACVGAHHFDGRRHRHAPATRCGWPRACCRPGRWGVSEGLAYHLTATPRRWPFSPSTVLASASTPILSLCTRSTAISAPGSASAPRRSPPTPTSSPRSVTISTAEGPPATVRRAHGSLRGCANSRPTRVAGTTNGTLRRFTRHWLRDVFAPVRRRGRQGRCPAGSPLGPAHPTRRRLLGPGVLGDRRGDRVRAADPPAHGLRRWSGPSGHSRGSRIRIPVGRRPNPDRPAALARQGPLPARRRSYGRPCWRALRLAQPGSRGPYPPSQPRGVACRAPDAVTESRTCSLRR